MKIPAMAAAIVMAAATAGMATAGNVGFSPEREVDVCVERTSDFAVFYQASLMASKMFETAGVRINWPSSNRCRPDAIRILISERTLESDFPGALAYALPYEGDNIVLFWDRIKSVTGDGSARPQLLAHVLVHEITHILQGIARHSETGILKARFTAKDIAEMKCHPLPFTAEDVRLIRKGMEDRNARLLAGNTSAIQRDRE